MSQSEIKKLTRAIQNHWPNEPGDKAKRYVGRFFNTRRMGAKLVGQVEGNHGTYTVSVEVSGPRLTSACSCYIGRGGFCHHCQALAITFVNNPNAFAVVEPTELQEVESLSDLEQYLQSITLDSLLQELKAKGITQKAFAEAVRMSPRHLTSIKSNELRNRFYHELGATKLACLWVLEHLCQAK